MTARPELIEEFKRRFPGLAGQLGARNVEVLVGATTALELPAGRKVIRDRMPVDSLYIVLDGELTISVEENKKAIRPGMSARASSSGKSRCCPASCSRARPWRARRP
jgi:hypothetical protein